MIVYGKCFKDTGKQNTSYNVWLDITQNSQSIANNTSKITVKLKLKRNDGYSDSARNGYLNQNTAKITVNGSVKFNENITFDTRNNATEVLGEWTGNVTHDADGKYSKTIKGEFTTGNDSIDNGYAQGTFTATTIPRVSTLSLSNTSRNPTQDITATISAASSLFSHKITYSIGSYSSINTIAAGTSTHLFTIPQSWANAVATGTSKAVSVTLQTLSGTSAVGTKSYSFNLTIPNTAAYRPSFNIALTRKDNTVPSDWGVYVQGKSGVSVNISNASYKYSATYKSVAVTVDGIQKTSLPAVYNTIAGEGTVAITVKVTDSRGFQTTETQNITVYEYSPPAAAFTKIERIVSEEFGDTSIYFEAAGRISKVGGKNAETVSVQYRQIGGSYKNAERLLSILIGNIKGYCKTDISDTATYELKITCTDAFGSTTTAGKLGTAFCALNVRKGGKGVAFGKYAEADNLFEIDYDLKVNGRCDERLLWSGELAIGSSCTLSDDLWKYRFVKFKIGTYVTYPLGVVYKNNVFIRAIGGYAGENSIQVYTVRGVYTSPSYFELESVVSLNLSTSGITALSNTDIIEIWGIK